MRFTKLTQQMGQGVLK